MIRPLFAGLLLLLLSSLPAAAMPEQPPAKAAAAPAQPLPPEQQEELSRRTKELDPAKLTAATVEKARLDVEAARIGLEGVTVERQGVERNLQALKETIEELKKQVDTLRGKSPAAEESAKVSDELQRLQTSLGEKQAMLADEGRRLAAIPAELAAAEARLALAQQWYQLVSQTFQRQQELTRRAALEDLERQLTEAQQRHAQRAAELRDRLREASDETPQAADKLELLRIRIQEAEEMANLQLVKLKEAHLATRLGLLGESATLAELPLEELEAKLRELQSLRNEIDTVASLLGRKIAVLGQQAELLEKRRTLGDKPAAPRGRGEEVLAGLLGELKREADSLGGVLAEADRRLAEIKPAYDERVRRGLMVRSTLPTDLTGWEALTKELLLAPPAILKRLVGVAESLDEALAAADTTRLVLLFLAEAALLAAALWLHRQLVRLLAAARGRDRSFGNDILLGTLRLFKRNWGALTLTAAVTALGWLLEVPGAVLTILVALPLVWLGAKASITLSWLTLAAPEVPAERRRDRLYRQLRNRLTVAALVSAVTLVGHLTPLSPAVAEIIDRGFMLAMLLLTGPVLGIRRLVVERLGGHFGERYWVRSVRVVSLAVPLAIVAGALLGLVGYINLTWEIGTRLIWALLVLLGFLAARGLLGDLALALKNFANARSDYGLLWAQGVIDPLYRIARLALALAALAVLFRLNGWGMESAAVQGLRALLGAGLLTVGTVELTLGGLFTAALVIVAVIWLARWSREVTYRWIYANIGDLGVRHSLSVFTQYAVVLVGLLAALRAVGIDLTTLAVFAGALGVGIGFGLQNVANNFISGILLLIERPLRTGDIVNIGSNEGEVTRIGIRSLTLRTWDNQEVMIPNSEVISNPFTNWTHSDNITRTVLIIGAGYGADPHRVLRLLEEELAADREVLRYPVPVVHLWEFADSAVNFRVQFFTDMRTASRLEVKSRLLLRIWDRFKREGVEIPFPQRDVHIRSVPLPLLGEVNGGPLAAADGNGTAAD